MRLIWHYGFAFVGGFLAMSAHVYWLYGRGDWFSPQRLDNTLSAALVFAHLFALTVVIARDVNQLPILLRLVLSICLGTLAWFAHLFLFLYQTSPDLVTLLLGGIALAISFFISGIPIGGIRLRFNIGTIVGFIAIYVSIYLTHTRYVADTTAQALLYFQADNPNDVYLIGLPFALVLAVISHVSLLFSSSPTEAT